MTAIAPKSPYKSEKFEVFLKIIDQGVVAHWADIARAIEVDEDTITSWKRTPQAQEAIVNGIIRGIKCMEQAGARDWRMWEAKLRMLGVNPVNKVELSTNPIEQILRKYGLDNAGKTEGTTPSAPEDSV